MICILTLTPYIGAMRLRDKLDPVSELQAIRLQYGLSVDQIMYELRETTDLSTATIYRMMKTGKARKTTVVAIESWLTKIGRRRYPIESSAEARGETK